MKTPIEILEEMVTDNYGCYPSIYKMWNYKEVINAMLDYGGQFDDKIKELEEKYRELRVTIEELKAGTENWIE